jgi:multidrug efflux pump subunit AcrA (membrane-fusion protein)
VARNQTVQAEAASASLDADRKAATVEAWRTERELGRARTLHERGTVSQRDLDAAQAAHDAARARVRALELRARAERAVVGDDAQLHLAEAELRAAELRLERTRVRAPFAGVAYGRSRLSSLGELSLRALSDPDRPLILPSRGVRTSARRSWPDPFARGCRVTQMGASGAVGFDLSSRAP